SDTQPNRPGWTFGAQTVSGQVDRLLYSAAISNRRASSHSDDTVARIGGWLFRQRTWLPLPIVVLLLVIPAQERLPGLRWAGIAPGTKLPNLRRAGPSLAANAGPG